VKDGGGRPERLAKGSGLKTPPPDLNLKLFELVAILSGDENLRLTGITVATT